MSEAEPKYHPGGFAHPETTTIQLFEDELIIDRRGRIRGQVIDGRLRWFSQEESDRLPRVPGR